MLAFEPQLQRSSPPERYPVPPPGSAPPLDFLTLHDIAERRSGVVVETVPLHRRPGEAAMPAATRLPQLGWKRALATARPRAAQAMAAHSITLRREREIRFSAADNSCTYVVHTSRDLAA